MASSEYDIPQEAPSSPADPAAPTPSPAVEPEPSVVPSVQPKPTEVLTPIEPAPPGEPGLYWCDEADPGIHPVVGKIQHGENDYTGMTHPDSLQAIGDLVAAGVLRKA
jgi:hypothetical protein